MHDVRATSIRVQALSVRLCLLHVLTPCSTCAGGTSGWPGLRCAQRMIMHVHMHIHSAHVMAVHARCHAPVCTILCVNGGHRTMACHAKHS